MKLLLDEMIAAVIAGQLRARDRDAQAVSEHNELRGLTDPGLFDYAQTAERALVTYNRDDVLEPIADFAGGTVVITPGS